MQCCPSMFKTLTLYRKGLQIKAVYGIGVKEEIVWWKWHTSDVATLILGYWSSCSWD